MRTMKSQAVSLTEGSVWRGMLRFFLPIMLGTVFQQLYSMVDAVILGQYVGKTALAAVGGSDFVIINLIVGFFVGLSSGAAVVISQNAGAGEADAVSRAVRTAMLLSFWIGALVTVLGIALAEPLLRALGTPEETMQYSMDYLQWYFAGMIPSMIYNMGSSVLRAFGDAKRPLYFLLVCAAVNTGLDLLFVITFKMEVAGAAIATSISQLVCAVLVLATLLRLPDPQRLRLRSLRMDRRLLGRMLTIGLPAGIQSMLYCVTNLFVQRATNMLDTDTVAAWAAFWKLDGVYWPISNALGIAIMTFVGQNYGAHRRERIFQSIHAGLVLHLLISAVFGALIFVFRRPIIRLFCEDEAVIAHGLQIVEYLAFCYPLFSLTEVFSSAMRGSGNAVKPTVITLLGVCVLRMAMLFFITFPHPSNLTIAICYPVTWAVSSLMFLVYYKFGKWLPAWKEKAQPHT